MVAGMGLELERTMDTYRLPSGETYKVNPSYYLASCDQCGWVGSSEDCGTDWGMCDDSEVYCPKCHASGADCGKVAETALLLDGCAVAEIGLEL